MRAPGDVLLARAPPPCRPGLGLGTEPSLAFRGVDAGTFVEPAARHVVDARAALADVSLDGAPPAPLAGGCGGSGFVNARETLALAPLPGRDHVAAPSSSIRRLRHTIFDSTKLALTVWFQAIYLITQVKKGVSAMKLHRHLGISFNADSRMKHKLMQVMMERDRQFPLTGWVELDDAYLRGERSAGKRGRGAPAKTPFVAAVETNEKGHPLRMKLTVVEGFRTSEIVAWAHRHLGTGT